MSEITKGLKIPGTLRTLNDDYPVADSADIAGGYRVVKKLTDMYSIPRLFRRVGMICYVLDEDEEYRLIINSSTNKTSSANWFSIPKAGSSNPGGPIDLSNYITKAMFEPIKQSVENLPNFNLMATKTDVQIAKNNVINYITTELDKVVYKSDMPDMTLYVSKDELNVTLNDYEKIEEDVTTEEINALFV